MISIINNQRKLKINSEDWQKFAVFAAETVVETGNKFFNVAFVSDQKMRELNKNFRGKNSTTDVLSFNFEPDEFDADENNLGDIVISVEQAAGQAAENNLEFEMEIKQLILHGILHLCGFDHEIDDGEMNRVELKYRRKLKINF